MFALDEAGLAVVLLLFVRAIITQTDVQDFVSLAGAHGRFL